MRIHSKVLIASLAAAMLMAIAVGSASARNFSISNQQIRVTFRSIEFAVEGLGTDRCNLTLEGSLHARSIPKVVNSLLGYITRVSTMNCTLTTAILALPWHIRYVGFSGSLPDITLFMVRISRMSIDASAFGFFCLGEPEIETNFTRESGGRLTEVEFETLTGFPVRSGGGFGCPSSTGSFRAPFVGTISLLGNSNDISVTLI